MYDIKEVISKMKLIANVDSNIALANLLDISYNTLNTWIKRSKLPQEILISFCKKYNCSLDYLLLNKKEEQNLFKTKQQTDNLNNAQNTEYSFIYYGKIDGFESLKLKLVINKKLLHSNALYLLKKNNIYIVASCSFDIFNNIVSIDSNNLKHTTSIDNFYKLNQGLITSIYTTEE